MEPDNLRKIRRNIHLLVKHTICKAPFLEFFVEKNVFGVSDIDTIRAKRGEIEQASEFYSIIKTRVNSYPVLIQGLHATDQSDIATMLEEGIIPSRLDVMSRVRKLLYEVSDISPIPRFNVSFNISPPVELFTGRAKEIEKLHQLVQRGTDKGQFTVTSLMTSVCGIGGIGKTQLARQYVKEHGDLFDGNCTFLHAETEDRLIESFRTLAKDRLGLRTRDANGTEKQVSTVVEEVYTYFQKSRSLFIFDNTEKRPWLRKFLPKTPDSSLISIIVTSRIRAWDKGIEVIDLIQLLEEEAVAMVKKGFGLERVDSHNEIILKLVRKLKCFPLTLQQAISYIQVQQEMDDYSIEDYLKDFENRQQELSFGEEDELNYELFNDYARTCFPHLEDDNGEN